MPSRCNQATLVLQSSYLGRLLLTSLCFLLSHSSDLAFSQDWPRPFGSLQDSSSKFRLPKDWTIDQVKLQWELNAGEGYSGAIGVDGDAFLWDRIKGLLRLRSVKVSDGSVNWTREIKASYPGGFDPDKGPRATPFYSAGKIYLWSAGGVLTCVAAEDGSLVWQKDLAKTFPGGEGYFGYGGGPIVISNSVIVNVGGRKASIVGLDARTGEVKWRKGDDKASYAAPISTAIDDTKVVLLISRLNFLVVEPSTGNILAKTEFGKRGATVNGASPVLMNEQEVFLNAAYGIGGKALRLPKTFDLENKDQPLDLAVSWENPSSFASQYITPIFDDGYLYGTTGREDFDDAQLRCVRASDGKVMWSDKNWSLAHGIRVGDSILLLSINSELTVLKQSPAKRMIVARRKLADNATRPLPALIAGYFIFRTIKSKNNPAPQWYCYKLTQ